MVFKGCQRCGGDMWAELDIVSRREDLVCIQCAHRQAVPTALAASSSEDNGRAIRQLEGASRVAAWTR